MVGGKPYYGSRVDVWSCGVILFAMVAGYLPFEDKDTSQLYKKIVSGEFTIPKTISSHCSDLMNGILCTDPDKRITTEGIRAHPWYQISKPVCNNQGLIIGKNEIPIEPSML
jgi:5'-AMP-activated protein kinase catalytic alpha subunit